MTPQIDTLLRQADPVRRTSSPEPGSAHGEALWDRVDLDMARPVRRAKRRRVVVGSSAGFTLVAASVVLILVLVPSPLSSPSTPAAAALARLAQVAAAQPAPFLGPGQWLHTAYTASLVASQVREGSTTTPNAEAMIPATIDLWANGATTTCAQELFSSATFASATNEQAWIAAGMQIQPSPNRASKCTVVDVVPSEAVGVTGAVDVAGLPTDPGRLAQELENGTTGIGPLDNVPPSTLGANPGFSRAVLLLVGPIVGATAQFQVALLNAMALLPGMTLAGTETTHSGTTGVAFTAQTGPGTTTVILSPSSGSLLEARNFVSFAFQSVGDAVGSSFGTPPGGGSRSVGIQWIDPVSTPTVVDSLPAGIDDTGPASIGPAIATISAVTKPGVTFDQLNSFENQEFPKLAGDPGWGGSESPTMGIYNVEVTVHAPDGNAVAVKALLVSSGLFTSVVVHN